MVTLAIYQAVVKTVTELVISAGIIIYGETSFNQIQLTEITEIYFQLWEDDGFTVRVPPEKLMPINILPDVKVKAFKS